MMNLKLNLKWTFIFDQKVSKQTCFCEKIWLEKCALQSFLKINATLCDILLYCNAMCILRVHFKYPNTFYGQCVCVLFDSC